MNVNLHGLEFQRTFAGLGLVTLFTRRRLLRTRHRPLLLFSVEEFFAVGRDCEIIYVFEEFIHLALAQVEPLQRLLKVLLVIFRNYRGAFGQEQNP